MTIHSPALTTAALPVLCADAKPAVADGLSVGGWCAMLFSVSFVTVLFVCCLVRVLHAKR